MFVTYIRIRFKVLLHQIYVGFKLLYEGTAQVSTTSLIPKTFYLKAMKEVLSV